MPISIKSNIDLLITQDQTKMKRPSQPKVLGLSFLQRHPRWELLYNIPQDHVIVDKEDWLEIIQFFIDHPQYYAVAKFIKDSETEK